MVTCASLAAMHTAQPMLLLGYQGAGCCCASNMSKPVALLALLAWGVASVAGCASPVELYGQCGGTADCDGPRCGDQAWDGYCCPDNALCVRGNGFYYQCLPKPGVSGVNAAPRNTPRSAARNAPRINPSKAANAPQNVAGNPPQNAIVPAPPQEPVKAKKSGGSYDYGQVLGLSLMFYEAQRSGKLPSNNRIKWRGDSGLTDRAADGRDVTGGWYDAGDNVKFNLPMAWSAGVLAWSLVDFEAGYKAAGQYKAALDSVKWATDYFIKCVGDGSSIVVQVGNGAQDHSVWGRPEDVKGPVPVYEVTPAAPGSDAVGAMGAALAAASVAFKKVDPQYSEKLLAASLKAYRFASSNQGKYSVAVPDAAAFYPSSNWMDDVAFNALWLYIRTGNAKYKQEGLSWYTKHYTQEEGEGVWNNFDWDSNSWGAALLLTRMFPNNPLPAARLETFVNAWTKGVDGVSYTPKGLAYSGPWGSLRHVGNALFLMKAYVHGKPSVKPAVKQAIDCTVKQQLGYILGDTGRSFVVGYGDNPPTQPHHRASSCPSPITSECAWDAFNSLAPNPQTLYGALVGGPGADDSYTDARNDFIKNEVATDYNAGFTGALAAASQGLKC